MRQIVEKNYEKFESKLKDANEYDLQVFKHFYMLFDRKVEDIDTNTKKIFSILHS